MHVCVCVCVCVCVEGGVGGCMCVFEFMHTCTLKNECA